MRRVIAALTAVAALAGCVTLPVPGTEASRVAEARKLMRGGDSAGARNILSGVVSRKGVAGVTDEALFHLGLLHVEDEEPVKARQTFERLAKDYPKSEWGGHARTLLDLLAAGRGADDLRRQLKNLRESNASLSRDNKELRLNLEKLKTLDLQLEKIR